MKRVNQGEVQARSLGHGEKGHVDLFACRQPVRYVANAKHRTDAKLILGGGDGGQGLHGRSAVHAGSEGQAVNDQIAGR
jgi:hypothetical protein